MDSMHNTHVLQLLTTAHNHVLPAANSQLSLQHSHSLTVGAVELLSCRHIKHHSAYGNEHGRVWIAAVMLRQLLKCEVTHGHELQQQA